MYARASQAAAIREPKKNKAGRFICANPGCKAHTFTDEENGDDKCQFHSGKPIFHDLKKYWSCCNPEGKRGQGLMGYDWDDFMKLPTCQNGRH